METSNTLKCGLCTDFDKSKKVLFRLPCSHWYCFECIMKRTEAKDNGSFICKFDDTSFDDPFIFLEFENSNSNKEILKDSKKIMCNIHLDEEIKYNCSYDNRLICDKCFLNHFSHKDQIQLFDYQIKYFELIDYEEKIKEKNKYTIYLKDKIQKIKENNIMEIELAHLQTEIKTLLDPIIEKNDEKNQSFNNSFINKRFVMKPSQKDPIRNFWISFLIIFLALPIIDLMQENANLKNELEHEKECNSKLLRFINESMIYLPQKFFHDFPDYKHEVNEVSEKSRELSNILNFSLMNRLLLKSKIFFYAENKDFINTLFPKNIKNLVLCYRASENSFDVKMYHQKCDGKGSWMVLVRSEEGTIFGGFSGESSLKSKDIKWNLSPNNFLFSFSHRTKHLPNNPQQFANMAYHDSVGPYFCNDLFINDFANVKSTNYSRKIYSNIAASSELGSCYSLPKNIEYGSEAAQSFLGGDNGGNSLTLKEYEVFLVEFD